MTDRKSAALAGPRPEPVATETVNLHFIPNTHLDREWTMDFQRTRALTVDFLDNLLTIMEQVPDYHFLLDAQSVPIEDYLEVRPENRDAVRRYVQAGRLNVGPWYTALDMNCICGETVVRNLLTGHQAMKDYGPVMKVGYTPFGWGQPSQLPQIYRSFGIDVVFFYRGVTLEQTGGGAEFGWTGADGSQVLCSRFGTHGRCNFFYGVWRNAFFADQPERLERSCNWFERDTVFKLCTDDDRQDHGALLDPQRTLDQDHLEKYLRELIEAEREVCTTSEIAFMHGMDTSYPDLREDLVMRASQQYLKPGEAFFYSSMPRYAAALQAAVDESKLPCIEGEARYLPSDCNVYNDIISSRPRQKQLTSKAEALLCRSAEPMAVAALVLGTAWPTKYLSMAWRQLLKCLPHDTIGGCSIDRVEQDAEYRLRDSISLSRLVLSESAADIQTQIDTSALDRNALVLTVFNPTPFARSEAVEAFIEVPAEWADQDLAIADADGTPVPFTAAATGHVGQIFRDKTDLALATLSHEHRLVLHATDVPALGYKCFVLTAATPPADATTLSPEPNVLENERIRVAINANGTVDVRNKQTGKQYTGLHYFEDAGESGSAWSHMTVPGDAPLTTLDARPTIECVENTPVRAAYAVRFSLTAPKTTHLDEPHDYFTDATRSDETVQLPITVEYAISRDSDSVEVATTIDNTAEGHRLRVCMPTDIATDNSFAESVFDVVERRIAVDDLNPNRESPTTTYPFLRFAGVRDGRDSFAIVANGLREYEVLDDDRRTLTVTLIRAFTNRICTTWMMEHRTEPGTQSPGLHAFRYRLNVAAADDAFTRLFREADAVSTPLIPALAGKKGGTLPLERSFFAIEGEGIELSCLKAGEDGSGIVCRLFNPTGQPRRGALVSAASLAAVEVLTMEELSAEASMTHDADRVDLSLAPKQILTLRLTLAQ